MALGALADAGLSLSDVDAYYTAGALHGHSSWSEGLPDPESLCGERGDGGPLRQARLGDPAMISPPAPADTSVAADQWPPPSDDR